MEGSGVMELVGARCRGLNGINVASMRAAINSLRFAVFGEGMSDEI